MNNEKTPNTITFLTSEPNDGQIIQSLLGVQVPDDLEQKIYLRQKSASRKRRNYWLMSIIFLLAIPTISSLQYTPMRAEQPLSEQLLHHVHSEMEFLRKAYQKPSQTSWVIARMGIEVVSTTINIIYAGQCTIGDREDGIHMVVEGHAGPITALYLPNMFSSLQYFTDHRFRGLIAPLENGSLAIIGETSESLEMAWENVRQQVSF